MILSLEDLRKMAAELEAFQTAHPDHETDQQPTICAYCGAVGIGRWACYCKRDD
jgi:hypothetical protein